MARGAAAGAGDRSGGVPSVYLLVEALAALPAAWTFISLVGRRWAACGIGINAGANSFTLVLFVAPVMVLVFAVASFATSYFAARLLRSRGPGVLVAGLVAMIGAFILSYALGVWLDRDYPQPKCRPMREVDGSGQGTRLPIPSAVAAAEATGVLRRGASALVLPVGGRRGATIEEASDLAGSRQAPLARLLQEDLAVADGARVVETAAAAEELGRAGGHRERLHEVVVRLREGRRGSDLLERTTHRPDLPAVDRGHVRQPLAIVEMGGVLKPILIQPLGAVQGRPDIDVVGGELGV